MIINGKKSVAWGQCAGVVGDRRALGVGHRGKAAAGGSGARGFDWNIYKLNNIIAAAPLNTKVVGVHGVVRGGGGKAVLG